MQAFFSNILLFKDLKRFMTVCNSLREFRSLTVDSSHFRGTVHARAPVPTANTRNGVASVASAFCSMLDVIAASEATDLGGFHDSTSSLPQTQVGHGRAVGHGRLFEMPTERERFHDPQVKRVDMS